MLPPELVSGTEVICLALHLFWMPVVGIHKFLSRTVGRLFLDNNPIEMEILVSKSKQSLPQGTKCITDYILSCISMVVTPLHVMPGWGPNAELILRSSCPSQPASPGINPGFGGLPCLPSPGLGLGFGLGLGQG